jgi:hypothetical protein
MTITISITLLVLAFLCFAAAALGVTSNRINLVALGLAFWVLTYIIK